MRWQLLLSILFSALTLALLILLLDVDQLGETLQKARLDYLGLAIGVVYPLAMLARGCRWWLFLNREPGWWHSFHIINIGYFANMVFPARLGEVARIAMVAREADAGKAVSAVGVERLIDLLFALLTVAVGLVLVGESADLPPEVVTSLAVFIGVAVVGLGILFFSPPLHPRIVVLVERVSGRLMPRFAETLAGFTKDTLHNMQQLAHPLYFTLIAVWSILIWGLYASFYQVVLMAFTEAPPIGAGILAAGFIALSIGVPSVPSFAGPFHVGAALALSLYGYDDDLAAGFALVAHALVTILTILVGVWSLNRMGSNILDLRSIMRRDKHVAEQ